MCAKSICQKSFTAYIKKGLQKSNIVIKDKDKLRYEITRKLRVESDYGLYVEYHFKIRSLESSSYIPCDIFHYKIPTIDSLSVNGIERILSNSIITSCKLSSSYSSKIVLRLKINLNELSKALRMLNKAMTSIVPEIIEKTITYRGN